MPRKGENIYKRKDGRWEGRFLKYHNKNKAIYGSVYAYSYQDVKIKLEEAKRALPGQPSKRIGTVTELSGEWLNELQHTLKESSINKYEDILRCYILPWFGNSDLSEITNGQIIDFGNHLLSYGGVEGKGLSSSMVLEVMSIMNGLRIHALQQNQNVSYTTECFHLKREGKDIRVLSTREEELLINWLCDHMNRTSLAVLLCLFTGIRIGEVCALICEDFDFFAGVLHISKTMQRVRVKNHPEKKTEVKILKPKSRNSIREIPIPDNMEAFLRAYMTDDDAFLLTGRKDHFVEPRTLENRFRSILKECGIEHANFHTTRHTFATRCVENGFEIKCLSEILGHSSVSITLNRYVHPSIKVKGENMARITSLYPLKGDVEAC